MIKSFAVNHFPVGLLRRMRTAKNLLLPNALWKEITSYYSGSGLPEELKKEVAFLKRRRCIEIIPYDWIDEYNPRRINVELGENGLPYVVHKGKRLYFPKNMDKRTIQGAYTGLIMEQDHRSPHRYLAEHLNLDGQDILVDVGCAEAIFSLEMADRVSEIYLFECDSNWKDALTATFEPWKEKTHLTIGLVGDHESPLSLDRFFEEKIDGDNRRFCIKMDVEGAEQDVLNGSERLLQRERAVFLVCTYHRGNDAEQFERQLREHGFQLELSDGYMLWYVGNNLEPPYFRKGLIRAWK